MLPSPSGLLRPAPNRIDRRGIACGGNFIVDRVKFIDRYPPEETLANILGESRQNGGCAFNVLLDLARLGFEEPLFGIGVVGDDEARDFVLSASRDHGVEVSGLRVTRNAQTSYTDVMTDASTGKRTFFHARGANALLAESDFDFDSCPGRHLHLGYLLLLDGLDELGDDGLTGAARVLRRAKDAGLSTSVDLVSEASDRFRMVVTPTLPFVDLCFMNEYELWRTTDVLVGSIPDLLSLQRAAGTLRNMGFGGTLVAHSERFGYLNTGLSELLLDCPPVEVRSSVGAGDAFAAGYLLGRYESRAPEECLEIAITAAQMCLSGEGASDGIHSLV